MDHKHLLRRYLEDIWQHRKLDVLDDYIAAEYVQHGKHAAPGRDGLRDSSRSSTPRSWT